jgi:hypothetical protein
MRPDVGTLHLGCQEVSLPSGLRRYRGVVCGMSSCVWNGWLRSAFALHLTLRRQLA